MSKTKPKKKRPEKYEKKLVLKDDVTFNDLLNVALGKEPKKKPSKKKNK